MSDSPAVAVQKFGEAMEASIASAIRAIEARPDVVSFAWGERHRQLVASVVLSDGRTIEGYGGGKLDVLAELESQLG